MICQICKHSMSIHDEGGCQHTDRTKGGIDLVCRCSLSPDAIAEKLLSIIEKLAKIDPMTESYQGNVSCFFCGALEEIKINGEVIHSADCLWLEATQQKNLAAQPT